MQLLTTFAEASGGGDVFSALGIEWQTLVFQIVGFIILVIVMMKWVYPVLIKSVDERQRKIDEGLKAARDASDNAAKVQADIDAKLTEARKTAKDIVATAREESAAIIDDASQKAKVQTERSLALANEQITKDVQSARQALEATTIDLIARATEKVVQRSYTSSDDKEIIATSLKNVREAKK